MKTTHVYDSQPSEPCTQETLVDAEGVINAHPGNDSQTSLRWIRPPVGRAACPYTGLKHAGFYRELVGNPRIRQARMGTGKRGTRLLWLPDVHAEINRRAEQQRQAAIH